MDKHTYKVTHLSINVDDLKIELDKTRDDNKKFIYTSDGADESYPKHYVTPV